MENKDVKVIFWKGKIALLDTPNDYIVTTTYDWITRTWRDSTFFTHYGNSEAKPRMLQCALDRYLSLTSEKYVPRVRFIELATRFKDVAFEEEDLDEVVNDMTLYERKFLGVQSEIESEV